MRKMSFGLSSSCVYSAVQCSMLESAHQSPQIKYNSLSPSLSLSPAPTFVLSGVSQRSSMSFLILWMRLKQSILWRFSFEYLTRVEEVLLRSGLRSSAWW